MSQEASKGQASLVAGLKGFQDWAVGEEIVSHLKEDYTSGFPAAFLLISWLRNLHAKRLEKCRAS